MRSLMTEFYGLWTARTARSGQTLRRRGLGTRARAAEMGELGKCLLLGRMGALA